MSVLKTCSVTGEYICFKVIGEYSGLEDLDHGILNPDGGKTQHPPASTPFPANYLGCQAPLFANLYTGKLNPVTPPIKDHLNNTCEVDKTVMYEFQQSAHTKKVAMKVSWGKSHR